MSHLLVHCILDRGWRCQSCEFQKEQSALHQRSRQAIVPALVQTARCRDAVKYRLQGRLAGQSRENCNTASFCTAAAISSSTFNSSSRMRKRGSVGAALCAILRVRVSQSLGQRHFLDANLNGTPHRACACSNYHRPGMSLLQAPGAQLG